MNRSSRVPRHGFYEPETLYSVVDDPFEVLALAVILSAADHPSCLAETGLDAEFLDSDRFKQLCGFVGFDAGRMRELVRRLYRQRGGGGADERRTTKDEWTDDDIYPRGFLQEARG